MAEERLQLRTSVGISYRFFDAWQYDFQKNRIDLNESIYTAVQTKFFLPLLAIGDAQAFRGNPVKVGSCTRSCTF